LPRQPIGAGGHRARPLPTTRSRGPPKAAQGHGRGRSESSQRALQGNQMVAIGAGSWRAFFAQSDHWVRQGQGARLHMQPPAVARGRPFPIGDGPEADGLCAPKLLHSMLSCARRRDSISAWIARRAGTRTGLEAGFAWSAGLHWRRHVRRAGRPSGRMIASAQPAGRPLAAVPPRHSRQLPGR
jgi:hypothetical protein